MEGPAPNAGRRRTFAVADTQQTVNATQELSGGPPSKREEEDALGTGPAGNEVSHAMSERIRLSGASARHDEQRVVPMLHRRTLLGVQYIRLHRANDSARPSPGQAFRPVSAKHSPP